MGLPLAINQEGRRLVYIKIINKIGSWYAAVTVQKIPTIIGLADCAVSRQRQITD
jgi:hypothetical protein